jgi:hypothetical protein
MMAELPAYDQRSISSPPGRLGEEIEPRSGDGTFRAAGRRFFPEHERHGRATKTYPAPPKSGMESPMAVERTRAATRWETARTRSRRSETTDRGGMIPGDEVAGPTS